MCLTLFCSIKRQNSFLLLSVFFSLLECDIKPDWVFWGWRLPKPQRENSPYSLQLLQGFQAHLRPEMQSNEIGCSLWLSITKCHFYINSHLKELGEFWWLFFTKEDTLWWSIITGACISLTYISGHVSVQVRIYSTEPFKKEQRKSLQWLNGFSFHLKLLIIRVVNWYFSTLVSRFARLTLRRAWFCRQLFVPVVNASFRKTTFPCHDAEKFMDIFDKFWKVLPFVT